MVKYTIEYKNDFGFCDSIEIYALNILSAIKEFEKIDFRQGNTVYKYTNRDIEKIIKTGDWK